MRASNVICLANKTFGISFEKYFIFFRFVLWRCIECLGNVWNVNRFILWFSLFSFRYIAKFHTLPVTNTYIILFCLQFCLKNMSSLHEFIQISLHQIHLEFLNVSRFKTLSYSENINQVMVWCEENVYRSLNVQAFGEKWINSSLIASSVVAVIFRQLIYFAN